MNMLDRGVLYTGLSLTVILAAVGIFEIKEIKSPPPDGVKGFMAGPIQITTIAGRCNVQPASLVLSPNAAGIVVQWQQQPPAVGAQDYTVVFQNNQSPFDNGLYIIPVPKDGSVSPANTVVSKTAVSNCATYGACIYLYTVTIPAGAACLNASPLPNPLGIVIKNP